MPERAGAGQHGQLDPGVVGAVAGRPDDRADVERAVVAEADRAAFGCDGARLQLDSVPALQLAWCRADQSVAVAGAAAEARVDGLVEQAELAEPPEEVAAEDR